MFQFAMNMAQYSMGQSSLTPDATVVTKSPSIDERLLFFPSKYPSGDWQPKNLIFQDVFFTAEDQTKLHGWYCPVENPRAIILIAHGNAGHIASRIDWLRYLQTHAKVSVLMFDYRGYGRSEGGTDGRRCHARCNGCSRELGELARIKDEEMLLMGESLGGAIVIQLAAQSPPKGLVLQSTFSSLREVAEVHYPQLAWLVPRNKLESLVQISQYHGPYYKAMGPGIGLSLLLWLISYFKLRTNPNDS